MFCLVFSKVSCLSIFIIFIMADSKVLTQQMFQLSSISGTMEPQGGNQRMFAMLETMREEQENLNRELAERVQEKTR